MLYLTSNCIFFWFPSLSMRVRRCFPWLTEQLIWKVEKGVMLGIEQFDLAVLVLPAAGFYRRERDIIDVIVAVVILLRGRKHEPRAADHPVDRLAGTIDPVPSVRR